MTTQHKAPADWKVLLDAETISRSLTRISYEILERSEANEKLAIVGIRTAGEYLAKRIYQTLTKITSQTVDFGIVDITLYRDDLGSTANQPVLKGTDLPFRISGSRIILVDDVLYTGRTVRSALDAITDFGRPACVELAALVDRGHRELPIRPDYIGKNIPTNRSDSVRIKLSEQGFEDTVYLIEGKKK